MEMKEYLAQYDDAYDGAEAGPVTLPDGEHSCVVTSAVLVEQAWGTQLELTFREYPEGERSIKKWLTLDNPDRLGWTKQDLRLLGYEGKLSDLEAGLPKIVGQVVNLNVTRKEGKEGKTYTNVYVNELVGRDEAVKQPEPAGVSAGQDDDDSIPF